MLFTYLKTKPQISSPVTYEQCHEKTCFLHMQNQSADQLHGNCAAPLFTLHKTYNSSTSQIQGARWLSGRVLTLEREDRGSKPTYLRQLNP